METLDNILRIDETYVLDDGVATVRIVGSGDFTGDFAFSPRLHVAWDIDSGLGRPSSSKTARWTACSSMGNSMKTPASLAAITAGHSRALPIGLPTALAHPDDVRRRSLIKMNSAG